jgi:hypothetical protein
MTVEAVVAALPQVQVERLGTSRVEIVVRRALNGPLVKGERIRVETRTGPEVGTVDSVMPRGVDKAGRERWLATVALDVGGRWVSLGSWENIDWERL